MADKRKHSYTRDWIYGGIDGAVTTFAIVSSVVGSKLASLVIIILGVSNLIADGFSMAASNYLGTKSEHEEYQLAQVTQKQRIITHSGEERDKVRQLLSERGMVNPQLDQLTDMLVSNDDLWLSFLLHEEHGLPKSIRSASTAAFKTFLAFLLCGIVPLIPYFLPLSHQYLWSTLLTGCVFFLIGTFKSKSSLESWWYSGLVTTSIGATVAVIAYGIGYLFHLFLL